ncbi:MULTISPECIES: hypothetical protein [unclassified Clostridium]|uniref:hypothetical protein n=1 Tax=unclassified Clostridium TaxID=2614128 RepID=UPI00052C07BF|nr:MULTISPECIES: hypothetical protein [unclassified Clostridium]KGK87658.1 hypothetical protein DP68_10235 [Clostridium sp. HMP27]
MSSIVLQYVLIVFLVVGIAYLVYILKDKGIGIKDDYFGIASFILSTLSQDEATPENVKKIIRAVGKAVEYVEVNYKDEDNAMKEDTAMELSKESLAALNLTNPLPEDSIRYIVRLAAALLPKK